MEQVSILKGDFNVLITSILRKYELIAPVEKKTQQLTTRIQFSKINDLREICLSKKAYYPVKGYFFKDKEVIFSYSKGRVINPKLEIKRTIFFGLRRCDLNGIWHQDIVFMEENCDPF